MPSRATIWFRDAFVIIFAIYVVASIAMVPWSNLKISNPASTSCPTGCHPSINFPENNYHHYDDSLIKNYKFSDINLLLIKNGFKLAFKNKMLFRNIYEYIYINECKLKNIN